MPTKQELAESLTIAQLRELAAEQSIDITGLTAKTDLVDAIVAGTTAAVIEAKITSLTTPTQEGTVSDTPPESTEAPSELSAADLELHGPVSTITGSVTYPTPLPEAPEDAEEPVLPVVTFDGREVLLDPDLQGRIVSFIAASGAMTEHPAHQSGDWSNPIFDTQEPAAQEA
jgi:hypothetical protein